MKKINFKNLNRKKIIKRTLILAVVAFIVFSFIKKSQPAQEVQEIITAKAAIGKVETAISGNGTLSPADQYDVKSLVKGEILQAPFEEGESVKKGALLYQISTNEIENSIKAAELNVSKAKLSYDNYLEKKNGLQISMKYSGYIKKLYVKEGEKLQPGKTIADIYNGDIMYIDLLFPSALVTKAWVGKTAEISMDATSEVVKGVVDNVSNMEEVMEGGILTKKVTIRVKNEGGIKVGDTAEASIGTIPSNNTGTFRAETEISLVAEAEGEITGLYVKEGQWLQKGDKVLALSSKDYESQLENANIGIEEAELSLKTQKEQMKRYTIEAPIAGQVITKSKKQGDTIDPATDTQAGPMATIYDMTYLTFQLNIDELQIHKVLVNQKVSITTEAFPEKTFTGVIERISLKGITNNGVTSYPVVVKVEDYGSLLPGMNVTGKIIIEEADQVLTVPSSALQRDNIVYVQLADAGENAEKKDTKKTNTKKADAKKADAKKTDTNTVDSEVPDGFKSVKVKIGINDGSNVEIVEGLKEGDIVYVPFDNSIAAPEGVSYETTSN